MAVRRKNRNRLGKAVLVVLLFAFTGCGSGDDVSTDLTAARNFSGSPLYYAGPEVGGESLSNVVEEDFDPRGPEFARWLFLYGDCTPPAGEGGCPLPVEIQNYPICRRWPAAYPWRVPLSDFKGAKLARRVGGDLEIYTGQTTIVIFTAGVPPARVAEQLTVVGRQQPAGSFPPPVEGSLQGDLPCQTKPG